VGTWPKHDADAGYEEYRGAGTLNVKKAKNDQHCHGCRKRYGRSKDPELDLVDQLKAFMQQVGLEPRRGCRKRQNPSEGCRVCPLLLPRSLPDGSFDLTRLPSPEYISAMIVRAVALVDSPAARRYVELGSPALLYRTWEAFKL
jgi:hypothetical protein